MMIFRLASSVVILLGLATMGGDACAADSKRVPNVEMQTAEGKTVRVGDFRGRVLLIDFWASWCKPCAASFPALDSLYRELHQHGLEVLAVNLDERHEDADAFLSSHPHAMPIVFDPIAVAFQAFAISGIPSSVIIDRAGTRPFTHAGYSDKIIKKDRHEINTLLAEQ
jgi:cytochrome c biogenesis protein CcmG/thiol:disulfide interchange protein DsbE